MSGYRVGQIIAMLDADKLPADAELEWVVVGATARIVGLPAPAEHTLSIADIQAAVDRAYADCSGDVIDLVHPTDEIDGISP